MMKALKDEATEALVDDGFDNIILDSVAEAESRLEEKRQLEMLEDDDYDLNKLFDGLWGFIPELSSFHV